MSDQNKLKVQLCHPNAKLPERQNPGDAGYDLSIVSVEEAKKNMYRCETGVRLHIPRGYVGIIHPRSSIYRRNLMLANTTGVIDSGYRGEILIFFKALPGGHTMYNTGDRVAQLLIMPIASPTIMEVRQIEKSHRGESGFGSTGD